MLDEPIYIRAGKELRKIETPGKLFKLLMKSDRLQTIVAEMDPHTDSDWYQHDGEEIHYIIDGEIEYDVGEKTYALKKGDFLWHQSNVKHRARNLSNNKAKYATVGSPPTFM